MRFVFIRKIEKELMLILKFQNCFCKVFANLYEDFCLFDVVEIRMEVGRQIILLAIVIYAQRQLA